jgi:cytochrome bd-type quinol oxidase subunit 2
MTKTAAIISLLLVGAIVAVLISMIPESAANRVEARSAKTVNSLKALVVFTAFGSWCILGYAMLMASVGAAGVDAIAVFLYLISALLAFAGSLVCLVGISKETKKERPFLFFASVANYCAFAVVIGFPIFRLLMTSR